MAVETLKREYTLDEFERLQDRAEEDGCRGYELEDGELIPMAALKPKQGGATFHFANQLGNHIVDQGLGEVFYDSFTILGPRRWYYPDLTYLSLDDLERYDGESMPVPSTLLVEITTRRSRQRDLVHKKEVYYEAGVPWYWVVDTVGDEILEFRRGPNAYEVVSRVGLFEPFQPALFPGLTIQLRPVPARRGRESL
jgi:Uma2 family endonuclease